MERLDIGMMLDLLAAGERGPQLNALGTYAEVRPDMSAETALRLGLVEAGLLDPAPEETGGPDDIIGLL